MKSTETPAERIAGDLALAAAQGLPAPTAERLAEAYDVPPATVTAAMGRLTAVEGARELLAAAAMCRHLDAIAGGRGIGPIDVAGFGQVTNVGEGTRFLAGQFLSAARRPPGPDDSVYLSGKAREIISLGRRATAATGTPVNFPWTRNPVADSFPKGVGEALVARDRASLGRTGRPGPAVARRAHSGSKPPVL
jgi:hypothetical protein